MAYCVLLSLFSLGTPTCHWYSTEGNGLETDNRSMLLCVFLFLYFSWILQFVVITALKEMDWKQTTGACCSVYSCSHFLSWVLPFVVMTALQDIARKQTTGAKSILYAHVPTFILGSPIRCHQCQEVPMSLSCHVMSFCE